MGGGVLVRVPVPVMATIVIETGVQNTVLALAIMNLTTASGNFSSLEAFRLQIVSAVWGVIVSFEACAVMLAFRALTPASTAAFGGTTEAPSSPIAAAGPPKATLPPSADRSGDS